MSNPFTCHNLNRWVVVEVWYGRATIVMSYLYRHLPEADMAAHRYWRCHHGSDSTAHIYATLLGHALKLPGGVSFEHFPLRKWRGL